MKIRTLLLASIAAFSIPALAAVDLQFTPGAKGQTYRKVLIAPAQVEFHRDFVAEMTSMRRQATRLSRDDVARLAREMGESFNSALAEAFKARGFEIALAPGSDVLRISPALQDLYVNAPEGSGAMRVKSLVREVGQARMVVEGRDATGARVVFAADQGTAGRTIELRRASDVSNRFWFEAMFRGWADEVAVALASAK